MRSLHPFTLALAMAATAPISLAASPEEVRAEAECRDIAKEEHVEKGDMASFMEDCIAQMLDAPEGDQEPAPIDNR
jgi:hypothetical protein